MTDTIHVVVNGEQRALPADTRLAELLASIGVDEHRKGVAVAVGDAVVRRGEWTDRVLVDGDTVEVVTAAQGG